MTSEEKKQSIMATLAEDRHGSHSQSPWPSKPVELLLIDGGTRINDSTFDGVDQDLRRKYDGIVTDGTQVRVFFDTDLKALPNPPRER
ncbi:hypothetical protein PHMEG_00015910 [Phytophthora megakarya]|uniref:Uncharacterized protein n=1 Tax=Phytophthora megakarya TaxID=4795 RepID=A0A225W1L9_9STRA|nr:hypothetical protein PHMEG_00015910 [Phytophthora megakarya]